VLDAQQTEKNKSGQPIDGGKDYQFKGKQSFDKKWSAPPSKK